MSTFVPQLIGVGAAPNDGTGDRPRTVALKHNANMQALATLLSTLSPATVNAVVATLSTAGLIKPDGTTLVVASDGTASVVGQTVDDLTDASAYTATQIGSGHLNIRISGADYKLTPAALVGAVEINIHDLTAGTALSSTNEMSAYNPSTGATERFTLSQIAAVVASINGTGTSSAVAPGQVGSLAAGTPTSTTIPLTWTAPSTGTAPITYTVNKSPHGASTWTSAAGTFGSTGGTVTGLTASTNYDFQVIATNSTGTSTTTLTTGVTTAASVSYPSMTLTSPTFATGSNAIFGSGASLSGGTGTGSLSLAVNPAIGGGNLDQAIGSLVVLVKIPATTFASSSRFISLTLTNGTATTEFGWYISASVNAGYYVDGFHDTSTVIADGTVKQLQINFKADYNSNYFNFLVGGTSVGGPTGGNIYLNSGAGNATLHIDMAQLPAGSLLDVVWVSNDQTVRSILSAEPTRDSNTNLLCLFNAQNGTGS